MASLRRFPRSPYWFACFTLPDGRRTQQSTKSSDRKEAQRIANKFEDAADEGRTGKLIEGQVVHGEHQTKALPPADEAAGFILTCCARPQTSQGRA